MTTVASKRFISRPALTVWNALAGKSFTAIDIIMDKKDAQLSIRLIIIP